MRLRVLKVPAFLVLSLFGVSDALAQSCEEQVGADQAETYVDHCLEVSPATHPPCNADNSCQMIWSEIWRSCDMLGEDRPEFCADYCAMVDYNSNYNPPVYCGG